VTTYSTVVAVLCAPHSAQRRGVTHHHQSPSIAEVTMKLITDEQRTTMLANSRHYDRNPDFDPVPVVKIFSPIGGATSTSNRRRR
jgi:Protein of unknown function (DUF2958)